MHQDEDSPFKSLFDSLHPRPTGKEKKWYEKLTIRGYSQVRFGRALDQNALGADPFLFGDRSINGKTDNFSIRRARMIISGDINEHLLFYFQSDFANNPADNTNNTFFAQIRDLYGDIYLDPDKINRLRVGQSKLPWGFEEMQSSGNRVPLDRSDAIDSGDSPNQRDLGIFYYWTPVAKQKLLKELVDGGLKGTGNYGIFALGIYNGQGGSELEQNLNLNTVARVTWPFQLPSGQVVETSLQGYTGQVVVDGASIRPLGQGDSFTPLGTGGNKGFRNQRLAASFVWYPQPFGVQTEWNVGQAPGLNGAQTAIQVRSLEGGYIMAMYKIDTAKNGIFIPYTRYQHYQGSYPSIANSPYGTNDKLDAGVEWQIWKGMEVVMEYSLVNGINLNAIDMPGAVSYRNFQGSIIRCQLQINY
ncbi:MAG TPA: porin [Urbifossiella sp.]